MIGDPWEPGVRILPLRSQAQGIKREKTSPLMCSSTLPSPSSRRETSLGAAAALAQVVSVAPELAIAHEMLGGLSLGALDDYPVARRHLGIAYRLYRKGRDLNSAARCATVLAQVEATSGDRSASSGWLGRTKRLIDEIGPCVEEGFYRIALMGCEVADVSELELSAARALEIAREFGDTNLEIRALAESGLALISLGRTTEGLGRLDEALTAVISGEIGDFVTCGLTCCAVVSACALLGDVDRLNRLIESLKGMANERFSGFQSPILTSHCHRTYGGMLIDAGRWQQADEELGRAIETSVCAGHRASALGGLAELRIRQNRTAEAADLLSGWEDRLETVPARALLQDAQGELALAASTLRWALREQETNLVVSAPLWAHLVEVELRHDPGAAEEAVLKLEAIARTLDSPGIQALALLSRGRVQAALGGDAVGTLRAGFRELGEGERPLLRAEIHLALAEAERESDAASAITEGRAAHAIFERLGSRRDADRAAALLRSFGVPVRGAREAAGRDEGGLLSRRERDVLPLLAVGLTNAEIAGRLFVTPKTVEHHVTSILTKLDLRSRTEVAAWAHRTVNGSSTRGRVDRTTVPG